MKPYPYPIIPMYLNGTDKWYIAVTTPEIGQCLLLDPKHKDLPIPISFKDSIEAINYIRKVEADWKEEKSMKPQREQTGQARKR